MATSFLIPLKQAKTVSMATGCSPITIPSTTTSITDGKLRFNDNSYSITSNAEIKKAVIHLINEEHLADTTGIVVPSKEDLHANILKETKPGGTLDYFTPIKGHEMDAVQIKPRLFDTRIGIALYQWGKANKDLGVATLDEAYAIFAEFKGRSLNIREKEYIWVLAFVSVTSIPLRRLLQLFEPINPKDASTSL